MGIFSFLENSSTIKGEIGYFGLSEWWLSEFSKEERDYIIKTFRPMGSTGESLIAGNISSTSETAIRFLSVLSGWFKKIDDRAIAYRILKKSEEMINESTRVMDLHSLYHSKIEIYYKNRNNDPDALEKAIEACKQQIEISLKTKSACKREDMKLGIKNDSLPRHKGFEQLAIIEEKQNRFESSILISEEALKQGWAGDWEKRIERCKKKLNQ